MPKYLRVATDKLAKAGIKVVAGKVAAFDFERAKKALAELDLEEDELIEKLGRDKLAKALNVWPGEVEETLEEIAELSPVERFWDLAERILTDDYEIYEDYSGRGMNDKVSPAALTTPYQSKIFQELAGCSVDQLGKKVIYYLR